MIDPIDPMDQIKFEYENHLITCARCGHITDNAHQGHYWRYCSVTNSMRVFHFCCPGNCELEAGRE